MYVNYGRTARSLGIRAIIATAATATICTHCAGLQPPPRMTASIVDTASIASSPSTIGIADSDLYGMSQADIDKTLDTLQSIGVQDVRIFVPWAFVEPSQGVYNWSYLDDVVNAASARNMGILAEVSATPVWDTPSGTIPGAGTPNPTDYASFLTQVATRYGTNISSYEIWNEPNYLASYDPIDPATYTALLKAAYPAIKAVDPSATVIAGALGSVVSVGSLTLDPVTFVSDMLADGAAGFFDALSFHPYQESLEFSQGASVPNSPLNQLNAIEQLLVASGLGADKVWLSEYGLPTSDVSQQTQATYIQDLLDAWQNISYAGPVFIYTAQDGTSTDPSGTYGIYNSDWTPKLAVAVIQQEIAKLAVVVVTNPVISAAQQLATAFAQAVQTIITQITQAAKAVAQAVQTLVQQIAKAFALPTATAAATPAVQATEAKTAVTAAAQTPAKTAAVTPSAEAQAAPAITSDSTPQPTSPPRSQVSGTATPATATAPVQKTDAATGTASPSKATSRRSAVDDSSTGSKPAPRGIPSDGRRTHKGLSASTSSSDRKPSPAAHWRVAS